MTDNAVFGCAIADIDGTVRYVNTAFAAAHGYVPEELIGRNLSIFHSEQQLPQVIEANEILKTTGSLSITEIAHMHRNGTEFPMLMGGITLKNAQGEPEQFVVSAIDISERKRSEHALLEREAQYRDLFENAPDAVFIADIESGRILRANSVAAVLTGRDVNDLIGMHHNDLHPASQRDYSEDSFSYHAGRSALRAFESSNIETVVIRLDGTTVPVDVTAAQVRYQGRRCLMGIFRDISAQKEANARIKALLVEKENLLKEVQHRVKNVMRTMGAMLSLQAASTEQADVVAALNDAASRFRTIELLYNDLYRSNTHGSSSLNNYLTKLIGGIVEFFGGTQTLQIKTSIADIHLPDTTLTTIGLMVNELITNAMKYAFGHSTSGLLQVCGEVHDSNVIISVHDNGPGLPSDFDIQNADGFGITMVQAFAQQLQGTFEVENEGGTLATLSFPLVQ